MKHLLPFFLFAFAVCMGISATQSRAPAQEETPGRSEINRLIPKLGSQQFADREAAAKAIEAIGEPALPALRAAASDNKDPEVRRRAADLVKRIEKTWQVGSSDDPRISVTAMAFSADGRLVLSHSCGQVLGETAKHDLTTRVREVRGGKELVRMELVQNKTILIGLLYGGSSKGLCLSRDGRLALLTSHSEHSREPAAHLWDLKAGKEILRFEGHQVKLSCRGSTLNVGSVRFSPDERFVLTASGDGTARLWDAKTGKELRQFKHDKPGYGCSLAIFSPDGRRILSCGGADHSVCLWDRETGEEIRRLVPGDRVFSLAFSADGRRALFGAGRQVKNGKQPALPGMSLPFEGNVQLWDIEKGKLLRKMEAHEASIKYVGFTPDGRRAVSASGDGDVRVWDLESGKELRRFRSPGTYLLQAALTPDGKHVLTGNSDNSVQVWAMPE